MQMSLFGHFHDFFYCMGKIIFLVLAQQYMMRLYFQEQKKSNLFRKSHIWIVCFCEVKVLFESEYIILGVLNHMNSFQKYSTSIFFTKKHFRKKRILSGQDVYSRTSSRLSSYENTSDEGSEPSASRSNSFRYFFKKINF